VRAYALVEIGDHQAVDVFVRREDAFAALDDAIKDEPDWAGMLSVVAIELKTPRLNVKGYNVMADELEGAHRAAQELNELTMDVANRVTNLRQELESSIRRAEELLEKLREADKLQKP